jgi:hypothetical protein
MRVYELAKELQVSSLEVVKSARALGFNVISASAMLHAKQVDALRGRVVPRGPRQPVAPASSALPKTRPGGVVRSATCACCGLLFGFDASRLAVGGDRPVRCEPCREHYEINGEDTGRTLSRYQDHERRVRAAWEFAAKKASEYEERMKAALGSRRRWKAALAEVVLAHEEVGDHKCSCGAKAYPCFTVKQLEQANRGIAREVERLGALSDEALDRELYPDEPPRYDEAI